MTVRIGSKLIGDGQPCFVIAEAGSNHNGNLEQARALVRIAAKAGADAVKFQTFRADRLYARDAGTSDYLKIERSIVDIIAAMEMPYDWLPALCAEAEQLGILFLSTPFDETSADVLEPFVPAYKIASYEMNHLPFVRHVARKRKPMVISTGAATLAEVRETMALIGQEAINDVVLLQCTAAYPAPPDSLNLAAMTTLRETFKVPVGLSDHSRDALLAPIAAVALGAKVIEKHFTFSNELPGPDHLFALVPSELRLMIDKIRECEVAVGSGEKMPAVVEQELRNFARRTIFTSRAIRKGEVLSQENLIVLRAGKIGHGLLPSAFERLLGKRAVRSMPAQSVITLADVSDDDAS